MGALARDSRSSPYWNQKNNKSANNFKFKHSYLIKIYFYTVGASITLWLEVNDSGFEYEMTAPNFK